MKIGSIRLDECNGKRIEDHKTLKTFDEILISHLKKDEDVLLFSHETSSMKHHLTRT